MSIFFTVSGANNLGRVKVWGSVSQDLSVDMILELGDSKIEESSVNKGSHKCILSIVLNLKDLIKIKIRSYANR